MILHLVDIYTDGACRHNPGKGGWAAILVYKDQKKFLKGFELHTTNNRMEMTAAIKALQALKGKCKVNLFTDSKYLQNGINLWLNKWQASGKLAAGIKNDKILKNADLWLEISKLITQHEVHCHWVKGHSGHPENELVDQLANEAIDESLE